MPQPMSSTEREAYLEATRQTDAIFALEGFQSTKLRQASVKAIVAGRLTGEQYIKELVEYAKEHKSLKGFLKSRDWA